MLTRFHAARFLFLFVICWGSVLGQHAFAPADWGVVASFPKEPTADEQRVPTPHGDQIVQRHFLDIGKETLMILRVVYPITPFSSGQNVLYADTIRTMGRSRPGLLKDHTAYALGDYSGERIVVEQSRDKTHREIRVVLIGASLYVISAEWPGAQAPSAVAQTFLRSIDVAPTFHNRLLVEDRERWREITEGKFRLRYDATRWYRNAPKPADLGITLTRIDDDAGVEFIVSPDRLFEVKWDERILDKARETAESAKLIKKSRKMRGSATVDELRFMVRVDGVNYENHGYFYTGAEGTMQLRAWSPESSYRDVAGDIAELLDGLAVLRN
ncbi:MAG: hypothetical protein Q8M02_04915 [Candidatus Didemnitutus sp.]|nr:hypothetical protein [Candidatus Didemnitutus sp.]